MYPKNTMEEENNTSNYSASLEPPVNVVTNSNCPQTVVDHNSSSNESTSSSETDSDADEEETSKAKRIKYQFDPKNSNNSKKKYDIWSNLIQEEVLLKKLSSCDIGEVDRSRSIETYAVNNELPTAIKSNQRFFQEHHKKNFNLFRRYNKVKESKRLKIQDVTVTSSDSEFLIAQEIASKLHEKNDQIIAKIVETIGKVSALKIFRNTKAIEEAGGMLTYNNDRRRTPGGVFLQLVKIYGNLTPEQKKEIFIKNNINGASDRKRRGKKRKRKNKTRVPKIEDNSSS